MLKIVINVQFFFVIPDNRMASSALQSHNSVHWQGKGNTMGRRVHSMSRADRLHDLCFFIFWYNDCDDFLFFLDRDAEDDSRFSGTAAQTF